MTPQYLRALRTSMEYPVRLILCILAMLCGSAQAQGLTTPQLTALRAACFADVACAPFIPAGDPAGMRSYMNTAAGTNAWNTAASVNGILDSITWANYTPNDAVSSSDTDPVLTRKVGWLLSIQTKQMNLQLMLQGRDTVSCARPNVRAGLRDAVIQVPSGAGGAFTAPGGVSGSTTLATCLRPATRGEIMLAVPAAGSDTTGSTTGRVLTWEGLVGESEATRIVFKDDGTIYTQ